VLGSLNTTADLSWGSVSDTVDSTMQTLYKNSAVSLMLLTKVGSFNDTLALWLVVGGVNDTADH
jgi:hypothetical protein